MPCPGLPARYVSGYFFAAPTPAAWRAFVRRARRQRFDVALQLYCYLPAANDVTDALGARCSAGFVAPGAQGRDLATHVPYPGDVHEIDRHLAALAHVGVASTHRSLEFPITQHDRAAADAVLRRGGGVRAPYAVLHPGATAPSRRWPPHRFAAVGDDLATAGMHPVLTGTTTEAPTTRAVAESMAGTATDLAGLTGLGALAAVLEGAAVVVTNDSGPAHLAAAVRTPTVTVFLAGDAARWAPIGRMHRVATARPACQPSGHQTCPIDFRCAVGLAPRHVSAAAFEVARR